MEEKVELEWRAEKLNVLEHETRELFVPAILNGSFGCTDQLRRVLY